MENISILTAIAAGFLSFVSPCVLPLIPAYISYISGVSLQDIKQGEFKMSKILFNSIAFVIGFSIVFILLGASASFVGKVLSRNKRVFDLIAGIVILIFGLHITGLARLSFLNYEKKTTIKKSNPSFFNSLLLGIAFSFGWTPCVGPILAAILTQASTYETMGKGIMLLSAYSLGLGVPFIITAVSLNKFFTAFKSIRKYFNQIEIFTGLLLIALGVAFIFGSGIHSWYLVGVALLSLSVAFLAGEKLTLFGGLSIFTFGLSIFVMFGTKFNNYMIGNAVLVILGMVIIYKEGRISKDE